MTTTGAGVRTPWWTWAGPLAALGLVVAEALGLFGSGVGLGLGAALLAVCVFAAVQHAEVVAARIGDPFGSIVLGLAVTVIEVALVVSVMTSHENEATFVARDTVFASVMLAINGVVGLSLLFGGMLHREQSFHEQGAASALCVLGTLATLTLILPDFTVAAPGPAYSPGQLAFVAATALGLYALFVFVQTIRHRPFFLDPAVVERPAQDRPSDGRALLSVAALVVALGAVVLIAESLAPALERAIAAAALPPDCVGVVLAAVVMFPEGLSAVRAARADRVQTALNVALGSALASTGLTIPLVAATSLWLGEPLGLGISSEQTVLLILSMFVCTLTLGTGRTTVLQGAVHLVILGAFLTITITP